MSRDKHRRRTTNLDRARAKRDVLRFTSPGSTKRAVAEARVQWLRLRRAR